MAIQLYADEAVLYPVPFLPLPEMVLVTSHRVILCGLSGHRELPAEAIRFVGRASIRPLVLIGAIVSFLGLPMLTLGISLRAGALAVALCALGGLFIVSGALLMMLRRHVVLLRGGVTAIQVHAKSARDQQRLLEALDELGRGSGLDMASAGVSA